MTERDTQPLPHVTRQDILDEVSKLRESVDRWKITVESRLEKQQHFLFGNGTPGIDEEVRSIKEKLDTLIRLAWIVVTVVTGAIVTALLRVIGLI